MSIGNAVLLALIGCGLALLACTKSGPNDQTTREAPTAWWYDITFAPDSGAVKGLVATDIDKSWRSIAALDTSMLAARISPQELQAFQRSAMSFSLEVDLDRDGTPETMFVGVYATSAGEKGRFVAVTEQGHLVQHFSESGIAGFSALVLAGDQIQWFKCMECGEYETISWNETSYGIE